MVLVSVRRRVLATLHKRLVLLSLCNRQSTVQRIDKQVNTNSCTGAAHDPVDNARAIRVDYLGNRLGNHVGDDVISYRVQSADITDCDDDDH